MQGKILMGILLMASLLAGTFFVSAAITGKNPIDYISSIRVADSGNDNGLEISESQEAAQLAPLSKITAEEAKAIALNEMAGEVTEVELENENGNVVYSVDMIVNNIEKEIKIDAGNGKVLKIESDDENESEEKESAEAESDED